MDDKLLASVDNPGDIFFIVCGTLLHKERPAPFSTTDERGSICREEDRPKGHHVFDIARSVFRENTYTSAIIAGLVISVGDRSALIGTRADAANPMAATSDMASHDERRPPLTPLVAPAQAIRAERDRS